jgi:L-ribulose-5-phosphate 3-epimerase
MTIKLGVITNLSADPEREIAKVADMGLPTCQLCSWDPAHFTDAMAELVVPALKKHGVEVSSFWAGYPGPAVWDFLQGPSTIGFPPAQTRQMRVDALVKAASFARTIGSPSITTHAGFIPEDPADPAYAPTVEALRTIALACKENGIGFWFETGQETPVTLLRAITDIGTDNLGINLDPANLLLYGKGNPVDALDVFGKYVRGVHAKDGEYPTDPRSLGEEKPLGEGRVNFPLLVAKLKSLGFDGALTIEREISGPKQIADIKHAMELLTPLIA